MKLTKKAIKILSHKDSKGIRTVLALRLNFTERWILKCIEDNKENGPLTTVAAVMVLEKETGLTQDELLESEVVKIRA